MANKLIIEKKAQTVEEIASKIKDSAGVVFVDYRGLTDEEITSGLKNLLDEKFGDVYDVKTAKVDNPILKNLQDIADDSYGIT